MPCNVIIQQLEDGVEVAAVNPGVIQGVENKALKEIAIEIRDKLRSVIDSF